jgi:hypothetical protein
VGSQKLTGTDRPTATIWRRCTGCMCWEYLGIQAAIEARQRSTYRHAPGSGTCAVCPPTTRSLEPGSTAWHLLVEGTHVPASPSRRGGATTQSVYTTTSKQDCCCTSHQESNDGSGWYGLSFCSCGPPGTSHTWVEAGVHHVRDMRLASQKRKPGCCPLRGGLPHSWHTCLRGPRPG